MRSAFASFIDHCLRVRVRLCQYFLVTLLRFGEFFFYFLLIKLTLLDLASALLQYRKDWFVGEALQKICDDAETDHLRQKQLPIPAERFGCIAQDIGYASATRGDYHIHNAICGRRVVLALLPRLVNEVERVEHNRLGQRNRENSMHEDLRKRAR